MQYAIDVRPLSELTFIQILHQILHLSVHHILNIQSILVHLSHYQLQLFEHLVGIFNRLKVRQNSRLVQEDWTVHPLALNRE